jgi:putative ABC transport system substrate-binding protein
LLSIAVIGRCRGCRYVLSADRNDPPGADAVVSDEDLLLDPFEPLLARMLKEGGVFNVRRRKLVKLFGSVAATWPLAARGQRSKVAQIGALYLGVADGESFTKELREGMRQLGYVEGQNVAFTFRSAEGRPERLPELAADLVGLKVDVIVALYVPCALAAKQATRDIPIVILAGDPVETGIVPSLARPGGNITGLSLMAAASNGKSVELFRDILPSVQRIGVLGHATNPVYAKAMLDEVLLAGGQTRVRIQPVVMVRGPEDLESAFATLAKEETQALVVQGSLSINPVVDLAIKYRLPAASTPRAFADIGGLMSFGADGPTSVRQAVKFVHAILQGKLPSDMPIEQPTKYELAVNLKTAKAIGLTIPKAFMLRVDALID